MPEEPQQLARFPFEKSEDPLVPPSEYGCAREQAPLVKVQMWNDRQAWLATRFQDVVAILADDRFSANPHLAGYPSPTESRAILLNNEPPALGQIDMPDHGRLRRMFSPMFTVRRMEKLRPQIESVVENALDALVAAGRGADLCQAFAYPIPTTVIAAVMGVPEIDRQFFIETANARFFHSKSPDAALAAGERLGHYFDGLLADRLVHPQDGDDVVNRLVVDQIQPGHLTREDAVVLLRNILVNGQDTTANMISIGTVVLVEHPSELEKLKRDQSLIHMAVAELLRFISPAHFQAPRTSLESIEYGGVNICAGEGIIASLLAADHDPAEFDCPSEFRIERDPAHHLAFGSGIHTCLGQQLAKLELEIALTALFERLPNLRLATPYDTLRFTGNASQALGIHELPVTW